MTGLRDIHGKRHWCWFFKLLVYPRYTPLFEGSLMGLALVSVSKWSSKSSSCNLCPPAWTKPATSTQRAPLWLRQPLRPLALSLFPSYLSVITVISNVHPPILLPQAGTESVWAVSTLSITSAEPTQLISSERFTAGKNKRQPRTWIDKNRRFGKWCHM